LVFNAVALYFAQKIYKIKNKYFKKKRGGGVLAHERKEKKNSATKFHKKNK